MRSTDDSTLQASPAQARSRLAFPRGAWLVIAVEFWERFSFYGMLAILALFLTDDSARGGFGWPDSRAVALVGLYTGAMYTLPAFGGYLADRVLGRRRAVALGASLMLVGQLLMASPAYVPWLLGVWHGAPLLDALRNLHVPLGYLIRPDSTMAAIAAQGVILDPVHGVSWLSEAYRGAALGLYVALACLIVGNALMKSTMVVLCGDTFAPGDTRREAAYAYYYLGIEVGALLSGIIVGSIAQGYGWAYGFSIGGFGMAIALSAYLILGPRWLGQIGARPECARTANAARAVPPVASAGPHQCPHQVAARVSLLAILALLLCMFSFGSFQVYGSWSLFIERSVDHSIAGFVLPVPWFASWYALVVIACAPLLAALWVRLAASGKIVDIVQKYAFALGTIALSHLLMYFDARSIGTGGYAPVWLPLVAFALSAMGELVAWTSTYDIVYRAAPHGLIAATMGAWYFMTLGLGGFASGATGKWVEAFGYADTFLTLGILFAVVAIGAALARGAMRRLAERIEVRL